MLEYLGQFSDQDLVKERLARAQARELTEQKAELTGVEQGWGRLEGRFLQHLDLLKREVFSEAEFVKADEAARTQVTALVSLQGELEHWVVEQPERVSTADRLRFHSGGRG